jgi:hypothetical protein
LQSSHAATWDERELVRRDLAIEIGEALLDVELGLACRDVPRTPFAVDGVPVVALLGHHPEDSLPNHGRRAHGSSAEARR